MSEKNLDSKGRWRNKIIAFRASKEEAEELDRRVKLSGHTKQDYITKKLLDKTIIVERSPKTYKLLKDEMKNIYSELLRIKSSSECNSEFLETIKFIADIYIKTKE